jgi:hypothetical protein
MFPEKGATAGIPKASAGNGVRQRWTWKAWARSRPTRICICRELLCNRALLVALLLLLLLRTQGLLVRT